LILIFSIFCRHYPQILTALSEAVAKEKHAGTLDNICGALARLVVTNSALVPMKSVSKFCF
jgi:importin-4